MPTQRVLGYDCRVSLELASQYWTEERRQTFLLMPSQTLQASVDFTVWPSLTDEVLFSDRFTHLTKICGNAKPGPGEANPWGYLSLLNDLRCAREIAKALEFDDKEVMVIAITLAYASHCELPESFAYELRTNVVLPPEVQASWQFLGFDVADSLISGLCNCSYEAGERSMLSPRFSAQLGDLGLFSVFEHADAFRLETDKRVPEHSPFFVFGVYQVPADGLKASLVC